MNNLYTRPSFCYRADWAGESARASSCRPAEPRTRRRCHPGRDRARPCTRDSISRVSSRWSAKSNFTRSNHVEKLSLPRAFVDVQKSHSNAHFISSTGFFYILIDIWYRFCIAMLSSKIKYETLFFTLFLSTFFIF